MDRPILFSGAMVRAILAGRKSQTRRVVKPHRGFEGASVCEPSMAHDPWAVWFHYPETERVGHLVECPYGKPGDHLWVRETLHKRDGWPWEYRADNEPVMVSKEHETGMLVWTHHKETDHCASIHMPRWASRITLEVTKVRAERLQDISTSDIEAEGCPHNFNPAMGERYANGLRCVWQDRWDSINAKRGFGWDANPWVWVIEFRRT
jgi:hypothetical protein